MLLLILFAGCLASCAAQTTTAPTTTTPPPTLLPPTLPPTTTPPPPTTLVRPTLPPSTTTTTGFPPSSLGTRSTTIQSTSVGSASASGDDVVAIFLASVQTDHEINERTIAAVRFRLNLLIQEYTPDLTFTLTVKNVTRV